MPFKSFYSHHACVDFEVILENATLELPPPYKMDSQFGLKCGYFSILSCHRLSAHLAPSLAGTLHYIKEYTQSPIIKNGPIRNDAEIFGKFKERTLSRSKLRNA